MPNLDMDDTVITKLVGVEQDNLRDATGQAQDVVPAYTPASFTPVAFTIRGQID